MGGGREEDEVEWEEGERKMKWSGGREGGR